MTAFISAAFMGEKDLLVSETQACLQVRTSMYSQLPNLVSLGALDSERPACGATGVLCHEGPRVEAAIQYRLSGQALQGGLGSYGETAQVSQ